MVLLPLLPQEKKYVTAGIARKSVYVVSQSLSAFGGVVVGVCYCSSN